MTYSLKIKEIIKKISRIEKFDDLLINIQSLPRLLKFFYYAVLRFLNKSNKNSLQKFIKIKRIFSSINQKTQRKILL